MITRRLLLLASLATAALFSPFAPSPARAQSADQATAFLNRTGQALVGVINGPGTAADKRGQLQQIIDRDIDVPAVARFCLGRYWRTATPAQQQQYTQLFHQVLTNSVTAKLGEFKGVTFVTGRTQPRDGAVAVQTVVTRPGTAPANVEWLVSTDSGNMRIIDVFTEGVSLRQTQRSDYASYLSHNSENVQALLDAMKRQVSGAG